MSEIKLTGFEKAELLKDTIYQLYSKEGRSFSYIGRLLQIDRKTISQKIKEWDFPEPEPHRYLTPSNQKFANKNRQLIKSRLDHDVKISEIAKELDVSHQYLDRTIIQADDVLLKAKNDYIRRMCKNADDRRKELMDRSSFEYNIIDEPDEIWKDLLGYPGYQISNHGRVKHYSDRYKAYHLLHSYINKKVDGRIYISITKDNKIKSFSLARLVAHTFCSGFSEDKNTVNHKDGNVSNNHSDNLEWVSQSENNKHAYDKSNRDKVRVNKINYKIIYKDKYEFKTVAAFARFINKSETQTRRYLEEPEKHDIKKIDK